ncbi:MAG: TonB C-terminal domain-containing protein [Rhodanobacteraceae bacterium]|nr:TonB C-terminal domain-containing protein [Rhodanobacteraceae bacterium]
MTARFVGASVLAGGMLMAAAAARAESPAPIEAYIAAVHAAIQRAWAQPEPTRTDLHCPVDIEQRDGGEVVQASFGNDCNADAATRAALEQAVRKASPLPYAGFETVFQRRIHLVFKHSGH